MGSLTEWPLKQSESEAFQSWPSDNPGINVILKLPEVWFNFLLDRFILSSHTLLELELIHAGFWEI